MVAFFQSFVLKVRVWSEIKDKFEPGRVLREVDESNIGEVLEGCLVFLRDEIGKPIVVSKDGKPKVWNT
jgi:hypothetical protein